MVLGAGAINYHFCIDSSPLKCKSVNRVVPNKNVEKNTKLWYLGGRKLGTRSSVGTKVKSIMTNGVMLDMESQTRRHVKIYGIRRLSHRSSEMKEFLELCDKQRGITFAETFEMKDIFNEIKILCPILYASNI